MQQQLISGELLDLFLLVAIAWKVSPIWKICKILCADINCPSDTFDSGGQNIEFTFYQFPIDGSTIPYPCIWTDTHYIVISKCFESVGEVEGWSHGVWRALDIWCLFAWESLAVWIFQISSELFPHGVTSLNMSCLWYECRFDKVLWIAYIFPLFNPWGYEKTWSLISVLCWSGWV